MTEQPRRVETRWDRAWQARMLPLMAGTLVVAAVFFGGASIFELRDLYSRVEQRPIDIATHFEAYEKGAPSTTKADPMYLRFKILAVLEANALQSRYAQANSTMLARVWTRQLGFFTGMVLAIVGAAFILGKLRDDRTTVEGQAQELKAALATSSPGIVLAFFGTLLMALTIWIPFGVETFDKNTYLRSATAQIDLPPPTAIEQREDQLFGPEKSDETASSQPPKTPQ